MRSRPARSWRPSPDDQAGHARSNVLDLFQGLATLSAQEPRSVWGRIGLILLGFLLIYLGKKGVLEAAADDPDGPGHGLGQRRRDVLRGRHGSARCSSIRWSSEHRARSIDVLQIDWLQPIYTFMFSNGLIACLVFMGIGVLLDVGFVMARPFQSMILALFAELGTIPCFPLAVCAGHEREGSRRRWR